VCEWRGTLLSAKAKSTRELDHEAKDFFDGPQPGTGNSAHLPAINLYFQ
jgi:hypothetical protein